MYINTPQCENEQARVPIKGNYERKKREKKESLLTSTGDFKKIYGTLRFGCNLSLCFFYPCCLMDRYHATLKRHVQEEDLEAAEW